MKKFIKECGNNVVNGLKTTIIGLVFLVIGLFMFYDQREDIDLIKSISFGAITLTGILLINSPDTFFDLVVDLVKGISKKYLQK